MHPAHRYFRIRSLDGADAERISEECRQVLHIPHISSDLIQEHLGEFLGHRWALEGTEHLQLVVDNTEGGRRRKSRAKASTRSKKIKEEPLFFLTDYNRDGTVSVEDYAARYGLTVYNTKAGRQRMLNALSIWTDPVGRDLVGGALLCSTPLKRIRSYLLKASPALAKGKTPPREVDIATFQHLFWDFTGYSVKERIAFTAALGVRSYTSTAVSHGLDAMLYQMGIGDYNLSRTEMFNDIATAAYIKLSTQLKHLPNTSTSNSSTLFSIMKSALVEHDKYVDESVSANEALYESQVEVMEDEPLIKFSEIIEDSSVRRDLDLVDEAELTGKIAPDYAENLRQMLRSGEPLSASAARVLYQATKEIEGTDMTAELEKSLGASGYGNLDFGNSEEDFFSPLPRSGKRKKA